MGDQIIPHGMLTYWANVTGATVHIMKGPIGERYLCGMQRQPKHKRLPFSPEINEVNFSRLCERCKEHSTK